jgi:hypothetical protein
MWTITCFNGIVWQCPVFTNDIFEALDLFFKATGIDKFNIKKVENTK